MKTVSGRVVSLKPVSVSKAARILSKFVSSDNGANPAFAAYLKQASASFNELVQFHKELKCSGSELKGKKKHLPDDIFTEETVNSVKKFTECALLTDEKLGAYNRKKHKSRNREDVGAREIEGDESVGIWTVKQCVEGNVRRNLEDQAGDEMKEKKKRERSEVERITDKDQTYRGFDSIDSNGARNNFDRHDGSRDATKKKKRDSGEREESDGSILGRSLSQDDINGEGRAIVENCVNEQKKHKKGKKGKDEKEGSGVGGFDQIDSSGGGNENKKNKREGDEGKKHKKKRNHDREERESEGKVEIKESDKKESRKRKHKESAPHEGLDDSEEQHRLKKKSKKHEV